MLQMFRFRLFFLPCIFFPAVAWHSLATPAPTKSLKPSPPPGRSVRSPRRPAADFLAARRKSCTHRRWHFAARLAVLQSPLSPASTIAARSLRECRRRFQRAWRPGESIGVRRGCGWRQLHLARRKLLVPAPLLAPL